MSDKEILNKAIRKAIAGGWELPFEGQVESVDLALATLPGTDQQIPIIRIAIEGPEYLYLVINDLIFNHKFTKSLWPKTEKNGDIGAEWRTYYGSIMYEDTLEDWQYHLQQMVIADDPIKYLGERL